jgi:aspartyl protease family protein
LERLLGIALLVGVLVAAVPYLDKLTDPRPVETVREDRYRDPRTVTLQAARDGHFRVDARVNGRAIEMLADTGATAVVLTEKDAKRAGFSSRALVFDIPVETANGRTHTAGVTLDTIEVDGIVIKDVRALVAGSDDLSTSLLGMTFLGRLANVTMSGDTLELVE